MQALELELAPRLRGDLHDRRDRLRIVRRELRIDAGPGRDQRTRTGEVGNISIHLAREDRIAGSARAPARA